MGAMMRTLAAMFRRLKIASAYHYVVALVACVLSTARTLKLKKHDTLMSVRRLHIPYSRQQFRTPDSFEASEQTRIDVKASNCAVT